jgi:hypothetical protein
VGALATWPVFSITSYEMLSGLLQHNVKPRSFIDVGASVDQFTVGCGKEVS